MNRMLQLVCVTAVVLMTTAAPALAQENAGNTLIAVKGAFAAGLVIIGAAFGIGKIGAAAVESMARQPEVAGDIRGALLLAAALIEGATFFALIVCIIAG